MLATIIEILFLIFVAFPFALYVFWWGLYGNRASDEEKAAKGYASEFPPEQQQAARERALKFYRDQH